MAGIRTVENKTGKKAVMSPQRLIQITDLHFREKPGDILCSGVVTDDSLRRVLDEVVDREGPDATVLVTGDLVQDAVPEAYRRLRDTLSEYSFRFHCLPGNHDDPALMRNVLDAPAISTPPRVRLGNWLIVLLNSCIPGIPHGRLGARELGRLEDELASAEDGHVLVALHHHPVPVGSAWLDTMCLADADPFLGMLATSDAVRAVLFGHVHQEIDVTVNGARLLGTPSTCVQFMPHAANFGLDGMAPAYRWINLYPDGRVESDVVFLDEQPMLVNA